jgi:SAM-dependent methyltransferase
VGVDANDARHQVLALVGRDQAVLHVGCGDGSLARSLVDQQCRVSGVEVEPDLAHEAGHSLEALVVADIDRESLTTHFKAESFDVVVFGNVLGRLRDPVAALRDAASLVVPGGRILACVTNPAHGAARLALLQGTPPASQPRFTHDALCDLLEAAHLGVHELIATLKDPLDGLAITPERLPATVVEWVRHQPGALDDRYIAVASPLADGDPLDERPRVQPAVPASSVRVVDDHTMLLRAEQHERHRLLTLRDHVLGLEAALTTARERAALDRSQSKVYQRRAQRLRQELEELTADIERMAATTPRPSRRDVRLVLARIRERSAGREPSA